MENADAANGELPLDKVWENFVSADNLLNVLQTFEVLKHRLGVSKLYGLKLFQALKLKLGTQKTWKARDVLNLLDKRANQREFMQQKAASNVRVFIVGSGPVGLRLAIDCLLLGSDVVVIEKRTSFSRHNVLHLWPFTIEDLRQLGAKKFYGKFCAGAIDHISIWRLQSILLKLSLLLGLRVFPGVEFLEVLEPDGDLGWHASLNPSDHPLNDFEFDILVGGDGARKNRIPGFDRKELRGKLALAITANFRNYCTRDEAAVEEISGVAFIFNQKFFKDLKTETGIDLENIVYYKDDTHYFVMTAKKDSLIKKGVLLSDYSETRQLLNQSNIDMDRLYDYCREAADWSTELPRLDFAHNHYGKPDVALFDFTSIHQAEYATRAIHRGGHDLFICLVGDALLEPFWPTGTGIGRGFMSAMDTAWLIRGLGQGKTTLDLLCERETIFQRLPQTTPEKMQPNIKKYTIDPQTRYPNLTFHRVRPNTIKHLYDVGLGSNSPALRLGSIKVKRTAEAAGLTTPSKSSGERNGSVVSPLIISSLDPGKENIPDKKKPKEEEEESLLSTPKRKPLTEKGSISLAYYAEPLETRTLKDPGVLLRWCQEQVKGHGIRVIDLSKSWSDGMALCALIHRYHPELIPFEKLSPKESVENNRLAFSVAEEHFGINSLLKPEEMARPDKLTLFTYLSLFYEFFLDTEPVEDPMDMSSSLDTESSTMGSEGGSRESSPMSEEGEGRSSGKKSRKSSWSKLSRKLFRRRSSSKKLLVMSPSSAERSWNTKSVRRPSVTPPTSPTSPPSTGTSLLAPVPEVPKAQALTSTPKSSRLPRPLSSSQFKPAATNSSDFCHFCSKRVYLMERMSANGCFFHRSCFRCTHCNCQLKIGGYALSKGVGGEKGKFFCSAHYRQLFLSNPEAIGYQRADAVQKDSRSSTSDVKVAPSQKAEAMGGPPPPVTMVIGDSGDEDVFETVTMETEKSRDRSNSKKKDKDRKKRSGSRSQRSRSDSEGKDKKKKKQSKRGKSKEPESSEEDLHRSSEQGANEGSTGAVSNESKEAMQVEDQPRTRAASMVKSLSKGFEQLEKNAKETEIQTGAEGREKAKQSLTREPSLPTVQPYEISQLEIISEGTPSITIEGDRDGTARRSRRSRSPAMWKGSLTRKQPEDILHLPRSSSVATGDSPRRKGRGQRSVTRPMIGNYDTSDVAIMERRKQQQRFRTAQLIQREMSQLERQYDELEVVGRQIEEALRDSENTSQEDQFMKSWLNLVNERNGLVRKTTELSLKMKELELEDRQYDVDKELGDLTSVPHGHLTKAELGRFEELCEAKVKIVEERNEIVMQTEDERQRELEENEQLGPCDLIERKNSSGSNGSFEHILGDEVNRPTRRPSAPAMEADRVEAILQRDKRKSRVKSWFGFRS